MVSLSNTYDSMMSNGYFYVKDADWSAAHGRFAMASLVATTDGEKSKAMLEAAACIRLYGCPQLAVDILKKAMPYATNADDRVLEALILRDLGVAYMDQCVQDKNSVLSSYALKYFISSRDMMALQGNHIQSAISESFVGISLYQQNKTERAIQHMLNAHKAFFNKNDLCEMKNLIWLSRMSSFHKYYYGIRLIFLAIKVSKNPIAVISSIKGGQKI